MAEHYYTVGVHGAPTPETAPHGFRWRAATGQRWFYGDFADIPANANDQWAPLPAPPTEQAPPRGRAQHTAFVDIGLVVCEGCGAVVGDTEVHDTWHTNLARVSTSAQRAVAMTQPIGSGVKIVEQPAVVDLMDALQASVDKAKAERNARLPGEATT